MKLDSVKNNDYISQLTLGINSKFMKDSEEMVKKTVDNLVTDSLIRKDLYVTQIKYNSIKFKLSPADLPRNNPDYVNKMGKSIESDIPLTEGDVVIVDFLIEVY